MYYIINGLYLSLYLAITLDFYAFRKQFESISAQLKAEDEEAHKANPHAIKQTIRDLIHHHVFMKR